MVNDSSGSSPILRHLRRHWAFYLCLSFGLVGVFPDFDHFLWPEFGTRWAHIPIAVFGGAVLCVVIALSNRLRAKVVLNDVKETK